jgi:hypothetical protein
MCYISTLNGGKPRDLSISKDDFALLSHAQDGAFPSPVGCIIFIGTFFSQKRKSVRRHEATTNLFVVQKFISFFQIFLIYLCSKYAALLQMITL